jgi:hypothetical protein
MKVAMKTLVDFDNEPLKAGTIILTTQVVMVNCLMADVPPNVPRRTGQDVATRVQLAMAIHKMKEGEEIEISLDTAKMLKDDVLRLYPPITSHQLLAMLDPALFSPGKEKAN